MGINNGDNFFHSGIFKKKKKGGEKKDKCFKNEKYVN